MRKLIRIPEPCLLFDHDQATEDPRDGLTLFGPLDKGKPYGVKAGVIGTKAGIALFERWVEWVQHPVLTVPPVLGRPPFPGFETVFRTPWNPRPVLAIEVGDEEIDRSLYLDEPHERVYGTVTVFAERLLRAKREEEEKPELWFVVVPGRVWKYCRPNSVIEPGFASRRAARSRRLATQKVSMARILFSRRWSKTPRPMSTRSSFTIS